MGSTAGPFARLEELYRFHFEKEVAVSVPFRLQGSHAFDAPDVMAQRAALRDSSKLRAAAQQFWLTLGLGSDQRMSEQHYSFVHCRIARALAPELSDEEACAAAETCAEPITARKADADD